MLSELLYPFFGWMYLWVRYRDSAKIKNVLEKEFDGSYYDCGAIKMLQVFGYLFISLLIVFLVSVVYSTIIKSLS
ncbi:hypothetical protein EAX61_06090 [Dokdonia sinensis]|uniref:Uncharacterized protein n=1 Tax=Dokdonia sinensis TaxID=2479847 RepID=A0A3M0G807_9FLAO|nr:hypothetical protein [Dokdonia sinensis]RMB61044.1 hypothetical protein EAX61_06090 [Dokdonia sinensis]